MAVEDTEQSGTAPADHDCYMDSCGASTMPGAACGGCCSCTGTCVHEGPSSDTEQGGVSPATASAASAAAGDLSGLAEQANKLVTMIGQLGLSMAERDPRDAEIERLRGALGDVCTALHNQLSDYDECGVSSRDHALYLVRQLGGRVRLRGMTIEAMQKAERERERQTAQAYAEVAAERDRLRAELAEIRAKLAEVHDAAQYDDITTLRAVEMLAEQRDSMMLGWGRCHERHMRAERDAKPAEPRRWSAGDLEPEIGTTVRHGAPWASGPTYTRRNKDGRWHLNTCGREPDECSGGGFEWQVLSQTPLVEVVSTDG